MDGKLGIFIHWGLYAVNGIPESWSFFNGQISYDDYMKQKPGFTAERYDPKAWAALFEEAGARYAVLTSKHHDGFALWPTELSDLDVMATPARRDLLQPYADALRAEGLKVGFYFSHLDWSHPDYAERPPEGDVARRLRGQPLRLSRRPGRTTPRPGSGSSPSTAARSRSSRTATRPISSGSTGTGSGRGPVGHGGAAPGHPLLAAGHHPQRPHEGARRLRDPRAGTPDHSRPTAPGSSA